MDVAPLNLGMIACYYNIKYTTIELFNSSLNAKTKLKGIIEILSSASEFESVIPMRQGEEKVIRKLAAHLPMKIDKPNYNTIRTKVNVLLQAHFSRRGLPADLATDQVLHCNDGSSY
jgi:pre-mRNA-splicing helicase BRR2